MLAHLGPFEDGLDLHLVMLLLDFFRQKGILDRHRVLLHLRLDDHLLGRGTLAVIHDQVLGLLATLATATFKLDGHVLCIGAGGGG